MRAGHHMLKMEVGIVEIVIDWMVLENHISPVFHLQSPEIHAACLSQRHPT